MGGWDGEGGGEEGLQMMLLLDLSQVLGLMPSSKK